MITGFPHHSWEVKLWVRSASHPKWGLYRPVIQNQAPSYWHLHIFLHISILVWNQWTLCNLVSLQFMLRGFLAWHKVNQAPCVLEGKQSWCSRRKLSRDFVHLKNKTLLLTPVGKAQRKGPWGEEFPHLSIGIGRVPFPPYPSSGKKRGTAPQNVQFPGDLHEGRAICTELLVGQSMERCYGKINVPFVLGGWRVLVLLQNQRVKAVPDGMEE